MSAQIVVLADYRTSRVRCTVTLDPLAPMRAWARFWMGMAPKQSLPADVRQITSYTAKPAA
jgi:hypothetical protein